MIAKIWEIITGCKTLLVADENDAIKTKKLIKSEFESEIEFISIKEFNSFEMFMAGAPGWKVRIRGAKQSCKYLMKRMGQLDVMPQSIYYICG